MMIIFFYFFIRSPVIYLNNNNTNWSGRSVDRRHTYSQGIIRNKIYITDIIVFKMLLIKINRSWRQLAKDKRFSFGFKKIKF